MAKYLFQVSYTPEGAKGLLKDGGSKRRESARAAVSSVGGTLDAMYYTFGDHDAIVIVDVPDAESVVAASLAINASGAVTVKTTVLITPEQVDVATKKSAIYTPPGR